jgi:small GTP-binding protein
MENKIEGNVKITLLGESTTGKSSIAYRLIKNVFNDQIDSTIGAAYMVLKANNIRFDIWDTAGQERYLSIVQLYYRNTDIFLLVFDVSDLKTLDRLIYYINKINQEMDNNYTIFIVGNKTDLVDDAELPTIKKFVQDKIPACNKSVFYLYFSTKTGTAFEQLYHHLIETGKEALRRKKEIPLLINSNLVQLENNDNKFKKYCFC